MMVKASKREWMALILVFVAGLIRYLIGLQSPHALSIHGGIRPGNLAVIGLMSKHVLERGEFPYFFWGQNWFGGLEAMLHGIAFWIFGATPWAMRVVTLFLFVLYCMLTYLIARDLFNESVGLLALCWCVVAPMFLTMLSLVPQTHYLETVTLGSLILWLALKLTRAKSSSGKMFMYLFLGLMGGISWWVTPLIIYYLAATAVFVLLNERFNAVRFGLILSLPAFVVGMLPLIIYYAHDPASSIFGLSHNIKWSNFPAGIKRMATMAGPSLLDIKNYAAWGSPALWSAGFFYIYVLVFCIIGTGKDFAGLFLTRSAKDRSRGILILFVLAITLIYTTSNNAVHKYAPRYLLSIYSFFPVACAYAVWQVPRLWRWLTLTVFSLLLCAQASFIWSWAVREVPKYEGRSQEILKLIDDLKMKKIDRAYADFCFMASEMTFLAGESIIFALPYKDRYDPYEIALDEADWPAFIEGEKMAFDPVLRIIGGSCREEQTGSYHVNYDFKEKARRYYQINSCEIKGNSSANKERIAKSLDRDMETVWESGQPRVKGMWVSYDLGKMRTLGLIRLWNEGDDSGCYAQNISIELSEDGAAWKEVLPRTRGDFYYWSGPRLYPWEWGYRWEARLGPMDARYVRITQYDDAGGSLWKIAEAYFYEDHGLRNEKDNEGRRVLLERVRDLGLRNVYADRWMSAKIRAFTGGEVETIEPFTHPEEANLMRMKSRAVKWGPQTGFILEDADADAFDAAVKEEEVVLERERYGRWELFYFKQWGEREEELRREYGWWWMGLGIVRGYDKMQSAVLSKIAREREHEGDIEMALKYSREALREYGNNQQARRELIRILKKKGELHEAVTQGRILRQQREPETLSEILFDHGVELIGYTLKGGQMRPGRDTKVIYYWRLHEDPGEGMSVFVHIEGNGKLIQGDHPFMRKRRQLWPALKGEVFSQEELLKIPSDIPAGKYQIRLGLFDPKTGKRWKIRKTPLSMKDRSVLLCELEIKE